MRHVSVQQVSAFLDGALVGVSRELVTRHLASCASCRERHAGWRACDDALRRVLAWEPDDRTFEEWSSRVELTIIAERKGLPPPEYSEYQHPVIAAPAPDAERLDIVVQSVRRTRRDPPAREPIAKAPPPAPDPPPVPVAPEAAPTPVESSRPEPESVEPSAPAHVELTAPVEPTTPLESTTTVEPTAPSRTDEDARAPISASTIPVVGTRVHDPGPPAQSVPEPLPRAPRAAPALRSPSAPPTRPRRSTDHRVVLAALSTVLLVLVAGSPLVPEVIRIPLPDWRWRLPRVEFVRHEHSEPIPTRSSIPPMRLATSSAVEPALVKREPIPAPVESASVARPSTFEPEPLATETGSGATNEPALATPETEPVAYAPITETARPAPRPAARVAKPARTATTKPATTKRPPAPAESEPPVYGSESPGTIVPTRVTTTVEPVRAPPQPVPAPAPPPESEEDWPLLCGTVVNAAGTPVEGARVVLAANALAVRTDRRGRFCVACPPGTQNIRVEATGQQPHTRTVELTSGMVEIRVTLTSGR